MSTVDGETVRSNGSGPAGAGAEQRYGGPVGAELLAPEAWTEVIRTQLRHRSVRAFTTDPVDEATVATLLVAAQSAPTSSNLQGWSVVVVRDPVRKDEVAGLCGDQDLIREAPVFLLWVVDFARARQLADQHDAPLEGADYLDITLVGVIDVALAAQNAATAAESLGLGTVYVGAARNQPEELARLLELPDHTFVAFGLALGHPDPERPATVKPRLPLAAITHHERYQPEEQLRQVDLYEQRMTQFYAEARLEPSWTGRLLARLGGVSGLHGRHRLSEVLRRRRVGLH